MPGLMGGGLGVGGHAQGDIGGSSGTGVSAGGGGGGGAGGRSKIKGKPFALMRMILFGFSEAPRQ